MATTEKVWKEEIVRKYNKEGFNWFGFFDIIFEIILKKKLSEDKITVWYTGYVKLSNPLNEKYAEESYREKNIIGVDSSDSTGWTEQYQIELIKERLKNIIKEHYGAKTSSSQKDS